MHTRYSSYLYSLLKKLQTRSSSTTLSFLYVCSMGYPSTWRGGRQKIERQIDTMMKRFVEHIDEQIDRLDESVDQVWQDTHEWNNIIRYLKTYSDDEYETLYKRAREPLDYLPEKNHMLQSLGDIIPTAQAENSKHIDLEISSIPEKRERMR